MLDLLSAMKADAAAVRARSARQWPGEFSHKPGMTKDLRVISHDGMPGPRDQILDVLKDQEPGLWVDWLTIATIAGRRFDGRKPKTLQQYISQMRAEGKIESRLDRRGAKKVLQIRLSREPRP